MPDAVDEQVSSPREVNVQGIQPRHASDIGHAVEAGPVGGRQSWTRLTTGLPAPTQRRLRRVGTRALTGVALVALLFVVVLVGFRVVYGGKVYPGISVGDVALGGMPRADAAGALSDRVAELDTSTVSYTFNGQRFTPTLSELGVSFDVERSLAEAYGYGREAGAVQRLGVARDLLRSDHQIPLYATVDYGTLNAWFDSIDGQLGLIPHDAFLVVDGTEVTIEPEVEGTVVDRQAVSDQLIASVTALTPTAGPLPTEAWIPNVRVDDLSAVRDQAEAALSAPIDVSFGGQDWTLEPDQVSLFLIQDNDTSKTGAEAVSLRIDTTALASYLSEEFAADLYLEPVDAVVGWNQGPVAVQASVDGHQLRPDTFAEAVASSALGDHDDVEIPVDVLVPAVDSDNLAALNMTTLLGRGDSNYVGSDYGRATNIGVGANLLNGTLVAPGAQFSFNQSIGVISADLGYVEARVIMAERIGRGIGGGICQVSTTMFRAALFAGLPIDEWWPHAQRIHFYEVDGWGPGYDASILQPDGDPFSGGDFKFSNPTDGWLLIESYVDGAHVVVNIYGPDTGWDVEVGDAVQSDPILPDGDIEVVNGGLPEGCVVNSEAPLDGLIVSFRREVLDSEGKQLWGYEFVTSFAAHGNVYIVAPDQQGNSPASGGWNVGNCDFSAIPL